MVATYNEQVTKLQSSGIDKVTLALLKQLLDVTEKAIWLDTTLQCIADITNLSALIDTSTHPSLAKVLENLSVRVKNFNTAAKRNQLAVTAAGGFTKDTLPKDVANEKKEAIKRVNDQKNYIIVEVVGILDHFIQEATSKVPTFKDAKKIKEESEKAKALMKSKTPAARSKADFEKKKKEAAETAEDVSLFKPDQNMTDAENKLALKELEKTAASAKSKTYAAKMRERYQNQTQINGETRKQLCTDAAKVYKTLTFAPPLREQSADSQECFRKLQAVFHELDPEKIANIYIDNANARKKRGSPFRL